MLRCKFASVMALAGLAVLAGNTDERERLKGRFSAADGVTWAIESTGASLKLTLTRGNEALVEVECGIGGRECDGKSQGKPAKFSMWFNGPDLVQLETRGAEVLKRKFSTAADGQTLSVEQLPVVPGGKPETASFKRVEEKAKQ